MLIVAKQEFATRQEALKAARLLVAQLENEELAAAEIEVRTLRKALKPFADYATGKSVLTDADWERAVKVMGEKNHG